MKEKWKCYVTLTREDIRCNEKNLDGKLSYAILETLTQSRDGTSSNPRLYGLLQCVHITVWIKKN